MDSRSKGNYEVGPFEQFGQFGPGRIDMRVFDQDAYWVDSDGVGHALSDMSEEYLRNVVSFLEDSSCRFHIRSGVREVVESLVSALSAQTPWLALADELGISRIIDTDALVWLESTPLMRGLRQRVSANGRKA